MKRLLPAISICCLFLLFHARAALSQTGSAVSASSQAGSKPPKTADIPLKFWYEHLRPIQSSFGSIWFIDQRADTSLVGYTPTNGYYTRRNIKDHFSDINTWLNPPHRKRHIANKDSLLVIVEDFRLGNAYDAGRHIVKGSQSYFAIRWHVILARASPKGVQMLGEYDSLMLNHTSFPSRAIRDAIESIVVCAEIVTEFHLPHPEWASGNEFWKWYQDSSETALLNKFPIMRDPFLHQGTYENYQQFLANSPRPDSSQNHSAGSWGYCDGLQVYVADPLSPGKFYPLLRIGDQWVIFLPEDLAHPHLHKKVTVGQVAVVVLEVAVVAGVIYGLMCLTNTPPDLSCLSSNHATKPGATYVPPTDPFPLIHITQGARVYNAKANHLNLRTGQLEF